MHIFLRHLAAKMPSQLYNNFNSFLPSYETCSINVNPLFHAAINTNHKNLTASSFFSLHLSTLKLSEENTRNKYISSLKMFPKWMLAKKKLKYGMW